MRHLRLVAALLVTGLAIACGSSPTPPSPTTTPTSATSVPVMGSARLSSSQLVAWFSRRQPQPTGVYSATEPVEALARYFIWNQFGSGVWASSPTYGNDIVARYQEAVTFANTGS